MTAYLRISYCAMLTLLLVATSGAQEIYCPATITTKQTIEGPPSGWTVRHSKGPHSLARITFFDGPPEEEASLVYDSYTKSKAADVAVWRFNERSIIWISCAFSGTTITLAKPLPSGTSECTVSCSREVHIDGNGEIKGVRCK